MSDAPCQPPPTQQASCCCAAGNRAATVLPDPFQQSFVSGTIETAVGPVPQLRCELTRCDRWGSARVRLGIGRMDYRVVPGLYGIGAPTAASPVLVSANYKLSFDTLRSAVAGLDAWILVLDSDGVNVWCAAGKGTFGTAELIRRIGLTRLAEVVSHRRLIVPQLGAPGIAGFTVSKETPFRVVWGPIQARDVPAFIAAGYEASPAMRRKGFPLAERLVLIPLELMLTIKPLAVILPVVLLLGGVAGLLTSDGFATGLLGHGVTGLLAMLGGVLAGVVLMPILLPWLPGRAFSLKGLWTGVVVSAGIIAVRCDLAAWPTRLEAAAWLLMATALASFCAMSYTGASTYTSLSGVRREMRTWVPTQLIAAVLGLVLWIAGIWMS